MYLYIFTSIHTYIHIYIYTYIHLYIYVSIHICIYTYIHIYIYTYIHMYICTYVHMYINIYIYIHVYRHIYIYSPTQRPHPQGGTMIMGEGGSRNLEHIYIYTHIYILYIYIYIHIYIYNRSLGYPIFRHTQMVEGSTCPNVESLHVRCSGAGKCACLAYYFLQSAAG